MTAILTPNSCNQVKKWIGKKLGKQWAEVRKEVKKFSENLEKRQAAFDECEQAVLDAENLAAEARQARAGDRSFIGQIEADMQKKEDEAVRHHTSLLFVPVALSCFSALLREQVVPSCLLSFAWHVCTAASFACARSIILLQRLACSRLLGTNDM